MAELGPLYSSRVTESCASVDEYCFLCASVDDGADGKAASIRTFVAELVRQHKEINHMVVSVDDIYTSTLPPGYKRSAMFLACTVLAAQCVSSFVP